MLEQNKIYHGDCLELMKYLDSKSIDIVFTSPPYNRKRNDKYEYFDDRNDDYFGFLVLAIEECLRVSRGYVIFNLQKNYYNKLDVFKIIGKYHDLITEIIVWEKTNPLPAAGFNITNAYELFIIFSKEPLKSNATYTKNVISSSVNSNMPEIHKAVMKQEISDWFIEKFTKDDDVILDPFLGIGTTILSCLKYHRKFIGIEISEKYYLEATRRISEYKSQVQVK